METAELERFKKILEEERAALERQLADYGASAANEAAAVPLGEGFADSAHATAERSEILSLIEQLQGSHAEVTAALERIERGAYGVCERCGRPISEERLEARPTARLCVECKQAVGR